MRMAPPQVLGELWIPRTLRVQRDNPDSPHHHYTSVGEHPDALDHPDSHGADRGTPSRDGAPPHSTTSLLGGGASAGPHSAD
jgi:hypothetical protein